MISLRTSPAPNGTPRRTTRPEKTAVLDRRPDGSIGALSSDRRSIYTVRLAPLSCTCLGFNHYGHCYHSEQALVRYGRTCDHCGHTGMDVAEYTSKVDGGEYTLCTDTRACLARQGWTRDGECAA